MSPIAFRKIKNDVI